VVVSKAWENIRTGCKNCVGLKALRNQQTEDKVRLSSNSTP
jgi:hypothetical protein